MSSLKAVYRNGVFEPRAAIDLPEGAEVRLVIERPVTEARERPDVPGEPFSLEAFLAESRAARAEVPEPLPIPAMTEQQARKELRWLMRDISEDRWCAGWYSSLEFVLWDAVCGVHLERLGTLHGYDGRVDALRALAERAGGWWAWSEEQRQEVFLPLVEWKARYTPSQG